MSSITNDIYNFEQSLTGNGLIDLQVSSITTDYLNGIGKATISYLDATSSIQTQINNIVGGGGLLPNFSIGTVNTTTSPTVTLTGTNANPVLNFGLVSGSNGSNGISFIWKGTYVESNTYNLNDVVFYSGSSYICIVNKLPNTNLFSSSFTLVCLKGTDGTNGSNGSNGTNGTNGTNGDATAATAAAVAAGVSAGAAATAATAASGSAASSASSASVSAGSASSASDSASLSASYARYFVASDFPPTETCNSLLRVKDTNNIVTVASIDQTGTINCVGTVTSSNLTSSNLNFTNPTVNISTALANTTINIGSGVSTINLNGIVTSPYQFNVTGFFNQL